jgi:tetratricopeptide (TPR) repeat protein
LASVDFELDPSGVEAQDRESPFRAALHEGRYDDARKIAERGVGDPETLGWEVTDMLEAIGLALAAAGEYDESIATFERAIELGWDVVPDARCGIARVLLEAGRHDEADALWRELWAAEPEATWLCEEDDREARRRWPMWAAGLAVDAPFTDRAARMERSLRNRRAGGDGPIAVVTLDFEHFVRWCEESGYDPADRRSCGAYMHADERQAISEQRWPPGRNEPCWCGSERKYKRCCGAVPNDGELRAAV